VRRNQLGRRNLTDERRAFYLGEEYNAAKRPEGRPKATQHGEEKLPQREGVSGGTAERLAQEHGVSVATVERAGDFAAAVNALPQEERKAVLEGKSGKSKSQIVKAHKVPKP